MKEDWLNRIRESQADFTEPEPEGLWEGIEAGLATEDGEASAGIEQAGATTARVSAERARTGASDSGASVGMASRGEAVVSRRRPSRWWWVALPAAAAVALVLFLSVPGREGASHDNVKASALAVVESADAAASSEPTTTAGAEFLDVVSREPESPVPVNLLVYSGAPQASGADMAIENPSGTSVSAEQSRQHSDSTEYESAKVSEESPKRQETSSWNNAQGDVSTGNQVKINESEESSSSESRPSENLPADSWPSDNDKPARKTRGSGFSLGLLASNVSGTRNSTSEYAALYGSTVTRQIHGFSETSADFPDSHGYANVMQSNLGDEISSSVKNWQPVQVGVSVAYSFTDRLSIESGLTYSCLVSDLSSGTASGNYDIRQTLHYIGLPLYLKYDFLKIGGFSLYASAGGQMEKCVAGKTRTDYFIGGKKISSESGRIMVEPLQWSVGAYVGAQYSFNSLVGLYVEPGAAYYFSNGSPVNCIYSERPFNFSLRAGLRFSLQR